MSESELAISVETYKRAAVITVVGRIDSSNAGQLDDALKKQLEGDSANLVVELSGVQYMSSAGLRALVSAMREAKKQRGELVVANPSDRVAEVFSLAGLATLFNTYEDVTAAVGSF